MITDRRSPTACPERWTTWTQTIREIRGAIFALQARETGSQPDPRAGIVRLVEGDDSGARLRPSLRLGAGLRTLNSEELTEQALIVLREALSNIARHAGASRADVTVDVDHDGILSVLVTDNGTGLPPGGRRSGLRNLADRAEKLDGELRLDQADPLLCDREPGWNGESRPQPSQPPGRMRSGP